MPRGKRICPAGMVFYCLNRAVAWLRLFEKDADYEAFERVLAEAYERTPLGILEYTIMPNHWHFVVCPQTKPQSEQELRALRQYVNRGTPYGDATWVKNTAAEPDLDLTLRSRGRPRKKKQ